MSKILVVRIAGGLGNQLFGYAAARRLALVSGAELVVDDVSGFERDYRYRRTYQLGNFFIPCRRASAAERLEPFARMRRYVKRGFNRSRAFQKRSYITQEMLAFDPRLLDVRPKGTAYLEGYWQSEGYFADVADTIRADLRILPPADELNQKIAADIAKTEAVAVHLRFFDAPEVSGESNAPLGYYLGAVERIEATAPGAHYFIFSDRPEAARNLLPLPAHRSTLLMHNRGDENAYADLWLMSQCQHFIIANSTFSWWGAWLGMRSGKLVIAPTFKNTFGASSWGFKGLLPDSWVAL